MDSPDLAGRILDRLGRPSYTPVKPKVLAKRLDITSDGDYAEFRRVLRSLIRDGQVEVGRASTVQKVDAHGSAIGLFRRSGAGLAFVRPHLPSEATGAEILVRDGDHLDASPGDEVMVKLTRASGKARGASGKVVRVLTRATRTFVGTYFERAGEALVRIDGTVFVHSVAVGDPGAKGAKPQDKVVVELVRFPTATTRGEGVVTEVLGPGHEPGVDLMTVIRAFGLPEAFPEAALAEARTQAELFDEANFDGRVDFTRDCVITIDPADARDFDDALSFHRDPDSGTVTLTVHIADVAHFAKQGGPLDAEAKRRATSIYLPGRVIPMFPEIISNGLASLQEGRNRYVQTVRMEYHPAAPQRNGKATGGLKKGAASFARGVIRNRKRFTYAEVQRVLDGLHAAPPVSPPELGADVIETLRGLEDLAKRLRARRTARGSLELTMPAAELEYDAEGRVSGAHFAPNEFSHSLVEECMLAANEAVAEHLTSLEVSFLRRVHPAPKEEKLEDFAEFARMLGYPIRRSQDRFELQRVLADSAEKPERAAVHFALLRSLKQANYSPVPDEHYALASIHYCHFTSPIRRYPDLVVHRQLARWLTTSKVAGNEAELLALGAHCSKMERRAEQAERELVKLKILQYMASRVGEQLDAVITGVAEYGFFAQAVQFPAEGLVSVASLTDDYYVHDEAGHALYGSRTRRRFRLGDRVRVEVVRVDLPKRQLDLRLAKGSEGVSVGEAPRPKPAPPRVVKRGKGRRG